MRPPMLGLAPLALLLGACSAVPPDSRMADVATKIPESWVAAPQAQAGVDYRWIRRFGDSSLEKLVVEGLERNHDLRLAEERVREAAANARLMAVDGRPLATASVNGSRRRQQFIGFPGGGGDSTVGVYNGNIEVNWELDIWGRIRAAEAAELAEWQARGYDYKGAQSSLAAQVARAWFALAEANEQAALAEASLTIREETAEAIADRFDLALDQEGGTASQLQLARADLAGARETLERWRGEQARTRRQLELLVGRYPAGENLSSRGLPAIPDHPPSGLPSELLLRRPDILAAERRYAGAGKRVKEAKLAVFPSLALTGSLGSTSEELGNLLDSDFGTWSLGAGLTQAILTGGRLKYERIARESRERQRLIELQKTVLDAFGEVEQALVADRVTARRVVAAAEAARHASDAAETAQADFERGTGDVLTLLQSKSRKITTAQQLITLRRAHLENRVTLHLALGGDFRVTKN